MVVLTRLQPLTTSEVAAVLMELMLVDGCFLQIGSSRTLVLQIVSHVSSKNDRRSKSCCEAPVMVAKPIAGTKASKKRRKPTERVDDRGRVDRGSDGDKSVG